MSLELNLKLVGKFGLKMPKVILSSWDPVSSCVPNQFSHFRVGCVVAADSLLTCNRRNNSSSNWRLVLQLTQLFPSIIIPALNLSCGVLLELVVRPFHFTEFRVYLRFGAQCPGQRC